MLSLYSEIDLGNSGFRDNTRLKTKKATYPPWVPVESEHPTWRRDEAACFPPSGACVDTFTGGGSCTAVRSTAYELLCLRRNS